MTTPALFIVLFSKLKPYQWLFLGDLVASGDQCDERTPDRVRDEIRGQYRAPFYYQRLGGGVGCGLLLHFRTPIGRRVLCDGRHCCFCNLTVQLQIIRFGSFLFAAAVPLSLECMSPAWTVPGLS